ncbi:response regulator containing CheY-like receiver domain and AraC-type DNA-binding domain [Candidatus Nitrososphaera evergladensis SR1]|uniref:Response regulator containing CheY-like receiver domain and AraC-type DNA-binding domain n=1 Tax=Candidatus Nitrososphaera evergladensis SR1 TaxID=1459636 RepID=A0A075MLY6_9ARCH|nr:response regulator [Candidatus Nitrososphaera evergladensis]AIF82253.1 response regulator containing CheY-like receiver domain and AraC-type DNA-binding domain [Candidatus Nitrososphaera evergladensis SR1]
MQNIDSYRLAETILSTIESVFGPRVFDAFIEKISEDYLGGEMSVHAAIMQRPELFELAFIGILGSRTGGEILAKICERTKSELGLDDAVTTSYSKKGDFAKFVAATTTAGSQVGTIIMIVDDDKDILSGIEKSLIACGYNKVQTFNDPVKALEHFKSAYDNNNEKEEKRDYYHHNHVLVLTDIRMHGMDGLRLAEELLRINPDAKIMPMSAYQLDEKMKNHLRRVTRENLLQKPFGMKELCVAVRNATRAP